MVAPIKLKEKMQIVIFEPQPDDLIMGAGHVIFDWIEKGHDIHVITITDGQESYKLSDIKSKMSENEFIEMKIKESKDVVEFLGITPENLYMLSIDITKSEKYVEEGIKRVKSIIQNANRILIPGNKSTNMVHQATYDIAIGAAKELKLKDLEYWVFVNPQYGSFNEDSKEKLKEIKSLKKYKQNLNEWHNIYETQKSNKEKWNFTSNYITSIKSSKYGVFKYEDIEKYYNF